MPKISDRMEALRAGYVEQLARVHAVLEEFLRKIRGASLSAQRLQELNRLAHKLAGSAGTYGFDVIGDAARKLEDRTAAENQPVDDIAIMSALSVVMDEISATLQARPAPAPGPDPDPLVEAPNVLPLDVARAKILIVDDDPFLVALVESLLNTGAEVVSATDGVDILSLIADHKPDLILLDDDLPGMSGVAIVERLQGDAELKSIPVIMLTGNRDPRNVMRAVSAGAVDYYMKPFEPVTFAKSILSILERMKYTVMIVDDDRTIHDLLRARFEMSGMKVITVENGRDALDLLEQKKPDLIILDRMMPGLEGGAVLHHMQQDETLRSIPVLMLTARNAQTDAHDWMRRGVADFMAKPFNPDEVILRSMRLLDLDDAE